MFFGDYLLNPKSSIECSFAELQSKCTIAVGAVDLPFGLVVGGDLESAPVYHFAIHCAYDTLLSLQYWR